MVNISPVSFQATPKVSTPKTKENAKEHKMASTPTKRSMNPLKAQLLALAMLGATTLNSCVYDERGENLKDAEEIQNIVTPKDTTVAGKANSMAKAIGLIEENEDFRILKTVSFDDDSNNQYYYQPLVKSDGNIRMNHTKINSNWTGEDYKIRMQNENDGIRYVKINEKKDTVENKLFMQKNDTIMEFDNSGKTAKIYKAGNKAFMRQDSDGNVTYFDGIEKNKPMPQKIIFGSDEEGWENN